jgi:CubicO group peptidase (beta-lactamase class C family)
VFEENEKKRIGVNKHRLMSSMANNNTHAYVAPNWESIRSVFEQNLVDELDIGASLCVYYQGECVVDLSGGWKDPQTKKEPYTSDTLQLVFSASKGVMAAAIALCVERGWLDYDAPVAKYWPEFAANGKQVGSLGIKYICQHDEM